MTCLAQAQGNSCPVLFDRLSQIKRHDLPDAILESSGLGLHCRVRLVPNKNNLVSRARSQLFRCPATLLRGLDVDAAYV